MYKKPSDETIPMMRNKCRYLKVLIIDEGNLWTFRSSIKNYHAKFVTIDGVSLLVVGYFLQLPSTNQKGVLMKSNKGSYMSFSG